MEKKKQQQNAMINIKPKRSVLTEDFVLYMYVRGTEVNNNNSFFSGMKI